MSQRDASLSQSALLGGRGRRWIAVLVLLPFVWTSSGLFSWAEIAKVNADPEGYVRRHAEDPRLRGRIPGELLDRVGEVSPRRARPRVPDLHVERQAVRELSRIAGELYEVKRSGADDWTWGDIESRLEASRSMLIQGFDTAERVLAGQGVPEERLARHRQRIVDFESEWKQLRTHLAAARDANSDELRRSELNHVIALLESSHDRRPEQPFDPAKLPSAAKRPGVVAPRSSWADFGDDTQRGSTTPGPEFLAATEDVQLTPEVDALAASLGDDPVRILEWVRNNIDFHPTYGSLQGSQLTLDSRRGNATDISSLLVALLRSAGIPSRYVAGTVNLPAADVQNWLGGTADAELAQQVLGAGAIPTVAIVDGPVIRSFDFEHTWVEAFVDMVPSRGAVNLEGDSWVPMDAAFKRYDITPPSGVVQAVPMDGVLDEVEASLTIDEATGAYTDIDHQASDESMELWAEQTMAYFVVNGTEQTPTGIAGGKTIVQESFEQLPATVPFEIKSASAPVATLPASLRQRVRGRGLRIGDRPHAGDSRTSPRRSASPSWESADSA